MNTRRDIMILIIEDEKNISNLLKLELTHANYECDQAFDGESGLNKALNQDYELILLDLMLPRINGIEVCRQLRLKKQTPIIMLTARDEVMDKVNGLQVGADDYLAKPFAMEELLARINALLRRVSNQNKSLKRFIYHKDSILFIYLASSGSLIVTLSNLGSMIIRPL